MLHHTRIVIGQRRRLLRQDVLDAAVEPAVSPKFGITSPRLQRPPFSLHHDSDQRYSASCPVQAFIIPEEDRR